MEFKLFLAQEKEYVKKGETLQGITTDTIKMTLTELDSVFVEKFIDALRHLKTKQ
jgi:hypothetical protein